MRHFMREQGLQTLERRGRLAVQPNMKEREGGTAWRCHGFLRMKTRYEPTSSWGRTWTYTQKLLDLRGERGTSKAKCRRQ